jgi:membrane-bound lytic murein transglycosylase D
MCSRLVLVLGLSALAACGLVKRTEPPRKVITTGPLFDAPKAPVCPEHPSISAWERRLRLPAHRTSLGDGLARGERYLPRIRRELAAAGVPRRLALLPLFESHFELHARGRFDEVGLWQLRPETATRFGLSVDERRDDRVHPVRATRAAARLLRHLHRRYGSWTLALAAYNAGERRVDRAMGGKRGATFWQLADRKQLPRLTRDYVPRFIALLRIVEKVQRCAPSPLV